MAKLEEYRRKRRFDRTPEPPPSPAPAAQQGTFVVQKHAATRLHYDFRLAIDGVLKSWAVPKGPSLNPADKRLAVQTEDHPLDYANFEGNIPKGNYGAGAVMVWDRGTFAVEGPPGADLNAARQVARGEIKFRLEGEKLRGSFVIVKLKHSEKGNEWLMIKHADDAVDPAWDIDRHDGSVLTGRTLDEIAAELPAKRRATPMQPAELPGARKASMASRVRPMLATLTDRAFSDPEWLFEIKWDGARTLAWIENGKVQLRSRADNNVTAQYPDLSGISKSLRASRAILDGEIVVLDAGGVSNFEQLQQRMHVRSPTADLMAQFPATYYVFDVLYCDGYDLRDSPLMQRKNLLRGLLQPRNEVRFSDHELERGEELFKLAQENGLEGIIGKRISSKYVGSRSRDWVKIKATKTIDVVVGGWTAPRGSRVAVGSLLLGLYEGKKVKFVGHAGSGFNDKTLKAVAKELRDREISKCPFNTLPATNEKPSWVRPELVARVRFLGWTQEPRLRAPVFQGLREDVKPEECLFPEQRAGAPRAAANGGSGESPVRAEPGETSGQDLKTKSEIEAELFGGKRESAGIDLDGKRFRLTHLNKVFFPESGYTKRDLIAHYYRVAKYILPFLKDRPLVLRRYPNGIEGEAFFQKNAREGMPEWIETVSMPSEGKREEVQYVMANDLAALLYLTGLGCIDHNPWSSRRDDPEHPDYFFFDLDPSDGTEFSAVVTIARALYEQIAELNLKVFLKTSGATGFHLYLPVERGYTYEQLRMFGEIVAQIITAKYPKLVTHERIVARRPAGRILIDVTQNGLGRPLAAAYSVRAFPGAPVSTPVLPGELRTGLRPDRFTLKTISARIEDKGDLWADFWNSRQRIEQAIELLGRGAPVDGKRPAKARSTRKK